MGVDLVGAVESPGGYVSKILYVETKESGPLGARPSDPPIDLLRVGLLKHITISSVK